MNLQDLNQEQRIQLKSNILTERRGNVSYGELSNVDTLVSDEALEERFGGVEFVEEDFFN